MLGKQKIVAFVAVRDRDAARKFYRDTLGLRLVGEDQFAMVFDANGTTLRLTPMPDWTPPQFTVLGWEVGGHRGSRTRAARRGRRVPTIPLDERPGRDGDLDLAQRTGSGRGACRRQGGMVQGSRR